MKILLLFISLGFAYSCKPANKEHQVKIDDSDTRKTIEQREQDRKGKKGLRLFNITRLADVDENEVITIPIAVSLQVKGRNIIEKAGSFLSYMIGESMDRSPTDTKIVARIKDLRRNHINDPLQRVTLVYQKYGRAGSRLFYGKNKHGGYTIRFGETSVRFPMKIGSLKFVSKKTGGSYTAMLVKEVTDTYKLTDSERRWMLGNIILYSSEEDTDFRRYIETGKLPNYISDKGLIDSRIHELNEKIKKELKKEYNEM